MIQAQLPCVDHMVSSTVTLITDIDQNNCTSQQKSLLLKFDSVLIESIRSFDRTAAPTTATGTRRGASDVMISQVPGSSSQSGSFAQPNVPSSAAKEKGRRNHECHICQ